MEKKFLIGLCVVLLLGIAVTSEDKSVTDWSSNVFCLYTIPVNATNTSISQCNKLSYVDKVLPNNNVLFIVSPPEKLKPSFLFVVDKTYENLTQDISFEGSIKKIVKFKNLFSNNGEILSLCTSGNNFAFGSSDTKIYSFELVNNTSKLKWTNSGEGGIKACDIRYSDPTIQYSQPYAGYVVVCSGNYVELFDAEGNLKWKNDLGEACKGVNFFGDGIFGDEIISVGSNKLSVFLINGTAKFSKQVDNIKSLLYVSVSGRKAVVLTDGGAYVFDGDATEITKIIDGKFDGASVSGVSGIPGYILLYRNSDLYLSDYSGKIFWNYSLSVGENITASAVDDRYALVGTDMAQVYVFDLVNIESKNVTNAKKYLFKISHDTVIAGFKPRVTSLSLDKGKFAVGYSDGVVSYHDIVDKHVMSRMSEIDSIVLAANASGISTGSLNIKLDQMREAYNQSQYSRVLDLASQIDSEMYSMKKKYFSEIMEEVNELIKEATDNNLVIPKTIKADYDSAYGYSADGEYDKANEYIKRVKTSLMQFIRDKALDQLEVVRKAKDALNKAAIVTTLNDQISEIDELKDYASAIVLFDKVKAANNTVSDTMNTLLKDANEAIDNVHHKFIFADPTTKDLEEEIEEGKAYLNDNDFSMAIGKITEATQHAKEVKTLALVEDVCIIIIFISLIIVLIFFFKRPKIKA